MKYINLGDGEIKISALGLGCMGLTHAYGKPSDENEMIKLIHSAFDMGRAFFRYCGMLFGNNGKWRYCV